MSVVRVCESVCVCVCERERLKYGTCDIKFLSTCSTAAVTTLAMVSYRTLERTAVILSLASDSTRAG